MPHASTERTALVLQHFEKNVDVFIKQLRQLLCDLEAQPENSSAITCDINDFKKNENILKNYKATYTYQAEFRSSKIFSIKVGQWINDMIPVAEFLGLYIWNLLSTDSLTTLGSVNTASLILIATQYHFVLPRFIQKLDSELIQEQEGQETCFKILEIVKDKQQQIDALRSQILAHIGTIPDALLQERIQIEDSATRDTTSLKP